MNARNDQDLAHRLILRAAHKAPVPIAQRLGEEWLADLGSRKGSFARLRLALGCCWATAVISRDFNVPQLVTSSASGHRPWFADHRYDLPLLSRRTVTLLLIAALHALLIYVFASGFAQHFTRTLPEIMHGVVIDETRTQPPRRIVSAVPFKPTVVRDITDTLDPNRFDLAVDRHPETKIPPELPPEVTRPEGVPAVVRVPGGPGRNFPITEDYYPSASRRLAEAGAATVQVCVDQQGYLTGVPTLAQPSGSERLDEAALRLARAGSGHYRPTTENGAPVNACYSYRIRFELTD